MIGYEHFQFKISGYAYPDNLGLNIQVSGYEYPESGSDLIKTQTLDFHIQNPGLSTHKGKLRPVA